MKNIFNNCKTRALSLLTIVFFGVSAWGQTYCVPTYQEHCASTNSYRINNFSLSGDNGSEIDNESTCSPDSYGDYTNLPSVSITPGETYQGSVDLYWNLPFAQYIKIWIDYNNDGNFSSDEVIAQFTGSNNFAFTVPTIVSSGELRLRVRYAHSTDGSAIDVQPCNLVEWGETEDYTVSIGALESCDGAPEAGTIDVANSYTVCATESFTLTTTGTTIANGITYQWQQREPSQTGTWTDVTGANDVQLTVSTGIFNPTDYRLVVACGAEQVMTPEITVGITDVAECYCIPEYLYGCDSEYIRTFKLIGDNITIDNVSTCGQDAQGYSDFTNLTPADLTPGQTYTATVHALLSAPEAPSYLRVWIDYNKDGQFSNNSESIAAIQLVGGSNGNTFSFTIPTDLEEGVYRMRLMMSFDGPASSLNSCGPNFWGETEDYLIAIGEVPTCVAPNFLTVENIGLTSVELNWMDQNFPESWNIEYGPEGFTQGTGTLLTGIGEVPYEVTGLTPNTSYDFYVQSVCSEEDMSLWSTVLTVHTACEIQNLPFQEGFEYSSPTLFCWEQDQVEGNAEWTVAYGAGSAAIPATAYEGNTNAVFVSINGNHSPIVKLITPKLNFAGYEEVTLTFAHAQATDIGTNNKLKVYAKTETDSDWILLASYNDAVEAWTVRTLTITASEAQFAGEVLQVAFEGINNYAHANVIDDVNVYSTCENNAGNGTTVSICAETEIDLAQLLSEEADEDGVWYDYNNEALENASVLAPATEGEYVYTYVVSANNCPDDVAEFTLNVTDCEDSGIEEVMFAQMSLYPNPTSTIIYLSNPSGVKNLVIEVRDLNGRLLQSSTEDAGFIDLNQYDTGIYLLRVYNQDGEKTFRVIKK